MKRDGFYGLTTEDQVWQGEAWVHAAGAAMSA
jgi:hypothetical protein